LAPTRRAETTLEGGARAAVTDATPGLRLRAAEAPNHPYVLGHLILLSLLGVVT
jgi:hypothetical protein